MSDDSMKNDTDENNVTLWRSYRGADEPAPKYKAKYLNIHNHHYHGEHSTYNEMERENSADRDSQPETIPLAYLKLADIGLQLGPMIAAYAEADGDHDKAQEIDELVSSLRISLACNTDRIEQEPRTVTIENGLYSSDQVKLILEKASEGFDDGVRFTTEMREPTDHWILCRHDIPSDNREVFCQNELGSFVGNYEGGTWLNSRNGAFIRGVLRWMEIPPVTDDA